MHPEPVMVELCDYMEGSNIDVDIAEQDLGISRVVRPLDLINRGMDRCCRCWCWTKKDDLVAGKCPNCP